MNWEERLEQKRKEEQELFRSLVLEMSSALNAVLSRSKEADMASWGNVISDAYEKYMDCSNEVESRMRYGNAFPEKD